MDSFILHTILGSPFARAILAVMIEKKLAFKIIPVTMGAQKAEPYLSRHPFGKIPVLEHGDFQLYETQAILRYLDRIAPTPALTPKDPQKAARMDQLLNIADHYVFLEAGKIITFQRVVFPRSLGTIADEALISAAMPAAHLVLRELSRFLGTQNYFTDDEPSLADFHLAAQLDFLALTPEWQELSAGRDNISAWLQRMLERPSLARTRANKLKELMVA